MAERLDSVAPLPADEASLWSAPSARARARAMRAAYASAADEHTRSLLRGLMEHFRDWCVSRGWEDPFPAPRIVRRRGLVLEVDRAIAPRRRGERMRESLAADA